MGLGDGVGVAVGSSVGVGVGWGVGVIPEGVGDGVGSGVGRIDGSSCSGGKPCARRIRLRCAYVELGQCSTI